MMGGGKLEVKSVMKRTEEVHPVPREVCAWKFEVGRFREGRMSCLYFFGRIPLVLLQ
jgi:hypothetical protein